MFMFIGMCLGGSVGFFLAAMMFTSKKADEKAEQMLRANSAEEAERAETPIAIH